MDNTIGIQVSSNKFKTPLIIFLVLLIFVIIIFTFGKYTVPDKKKNYESKLDKALNAAGIISIKKSENFDNDIKFNSIESVNNNFEKFMDIYYPLVDMNTINNLLSKFKINTTIQNEINNKKINIIDIFTEKYEFITQLILLSFTNNKFEDLLLLGLGSIVMIKIKNPSLNNHKIYFYQTNNYNFDIYIYLILKNISKN